MNRQILLIMWVIFTVISGNDSIAFARGTVSTDTLLKYTRLNDGAYIFSVDDKNYNSLTELGQVIYPRFKNGEGFSFDNISEKLIEADILSNNIPLIIDFTQGLSMLTGESFTFEEAELVVRVLNIARDNGFNPFQEISFNNFFRAEKAGRLDLRKVVGLFEGLSGIIDGLRALGGNNASVIGQLAANNSTLKALIVQRDLLEQQPSSVGNTNQLNLVNRQIMRAFFETPEGIQVRNSPQNQENLKNGIETVQELQGLFSTRTSNVQAAADSLLLYLADPSTTSIKNMPEVQKPDTHTTSSLLNSSLVTSNILNNRINVVNKFGTAAGEEIETYGLWVKGSFSSGVQKPYKSEPGYKFEQKGVMIGVDTGDDIDGESMIGLAGSFFRNDVTNKTSLSARDKIDTYTGSFYGLFSVNSKLFFSGQASYGYSNIKKRRSTGDLANNLATAKTKATTLVARFKGGYVYEFSNNMQIVPTIGIGRTNIKVKGYSEKGMGLNRAVGNRKVIRTYGLIGISGRYVTQVGNMKIRPELHANMDYALNSKNSTTKINLSDIIDLTTPSEKLARSFYNIGASIKFVTSNMIDITTGYDLGLSTKFVSHTGILKLRVNL